MAFILNEVDIFPLLFTKFAHIICFHFFCEGYLFTIKSFKFVVLVVCKCTCFASFLALNYLPGIEASPFMGVDNSYFKLGKLRCIDCTQYVIINYDLRLVDQVLHSTN